MMRFIKELFGGLIGICFLFTVSAGAAAASMNDERLISLLDTGGYEKIREVARQLYDAEEPSTQLLDTLATVVYQSYEVPDLRVIDSLAWGCRALGESKRYRYFSLVNEMGQFAPNAKLRDYCQQATLTIKEAREKGETLAEPQLTSEEMSMQPVWYPGETVDLHISYRIYPGPLRKKMMTDNHRRIEYLTTGSTDQVTRELKNIYGDKGKTPFEVNEAAARIIWDFVEGGEGVEAGDTVGWACKAVAASTSSRYQDLVLEAAAHGREKSEAVAKDCSRAYKLVSQESNTRQFEPEYLLTYADSRENAYEISDIKEVRDQLSVLKQLRSLGVIDRQTYNSTREAILANLL